MRCGVVGRQGLRSDPPRWQTAKPGMRKSALIETAAAGGVSGGPPCRWRGRRRWSLRFSLESLDGRIRNCSRWFSPYIPKICHALRLPRVSWAPGRIRWLVFGPALPACTATSGSRRASRLGSPLVLALARRLERCALCQSTAMMRFAVLKGIQGFGDRLQCLLQAIRYAKNCNRVLVVDWRDTDWTHEPDDFGFEDFFKLHGVNVFSLDSFIQYFDEHKRTLSVEPSSWRYKITDWKYQNWIYESTFNYPIEEGHEVHNQVIGEICEYKRADFDADIVVLPGVYRRVCHYVDVRYIRLSRWVQYLVEQNIKAHSSLRRFQYDAIHLRGGSKKWAGGHVPMKELAAQIDSTWPDEDTYFERIHSAYTNLIGTMESLPLLLVTDSSLLADRWQDRYGKCLTMPTFNSVLEESGTHKISAEKLKSEAISKADLNIELIRDFVLLTNSRSITWDGISLFSKAAVGCKKTNANILWIED